MKIVVDDLRLAPNGWTLFKNPESFIHWRQKHPDVRIDCLSLDHDMGLEYQSGYDLVKALVNDKSLHLTHIKRIQFHTDNMIGFKNMYGYLTNYQSTGEIQNMKIIEEKMNLIDGLFSFSGYSPIPTREKE